MRLKIKLGGVVLLFLSDQDMEIHAELLPFLVPDEDEAEEITILVKRDWENVRLPETEPLGEDLICRYYSQNGQRYCVTRGGRAGTIACSVYTCECTRIVCTINEGVLRRPFRQAGTIFRMLPMREIFLAKNILFFHAAQIAVDGKGILFSAPSGTGKTTQAKLWEKYRNAEIICSDRTLVHKTEGAWRTYGYPADGSEPVRSGKVHTLGCIVLLKQGAENQIIKLTAAKALAGLMPQMVLDCWNPEARTKAVELLLQIFADIPVFLFSCTCDESAVKILEEELQRRGVIENGENY